jgi:hypothetical protein
MNLATGWRFTENAAEKRTLWAGEVRISPGGSPKSLIAVGN